MSVKSLRHKMLDRNLIHAKIRFCKIIFFPYLISQKIQLIFSKAFNQVSPCFSLMISGIGKVHYANIEESFFNAITDTSFCTNDI
jgi:hypothetical protein